MNTISLAMSAAGLVVVMGVWISYLSKIPRGKVPARPVGSIILQCVGVVLAVSAIAWSFLGEGASGVAVIAPAVFALMMGSTFFWLLSIRKTPIGDLKVNVGDKLLEFEAVTAEGTRFHTDDLVGRRTLLKFFRGGW